MTEIEYDSFTHTGEVKIPGALIDQVLGQDEAVAILKQAAAQRRFVLLVGEPGTGKSMLGRAMSEMLTTEKLQDILVLPNVGNKNLPLIRSVEAGSGQKSVAQLAREADRAAGSLKFTYGVITVSSLALGGLWSFLEKTPVYTVAGAIGAALAWFVGRRSVAQKTRQVPKILVEQPFPLRAPFIDATGSQAGSMLGDVRHDPFQSGGVETPPHELIEAGAIHRAHQGVLYIDEVGLLGLDVQQSLLGAIQERSFAITGRSLGSSGLMVRTEPVPCDFVLVLAGNMPDLEGIHPALRSRIRGYGYEVYTHDSMPDTPVNRRKLVQFIAQEVRRDGRISDFTREAALEVVEEARRHAGSRDRLTLKLRNLGGLVRAAGDLAKSAASVHVEKIHVLRAKDLVKPLEIQVMERRVAAESKHILSRLTPKVGQVHSFCIVSKVCGAPLTFACEVQSVRAKGREGQLRCDGPARSRIESAARIADSLLRKRSKKSLQDLDISFQILQDYPDLEFEKDSAAVALAILSAASNITLRQDCALLGEVHINGDLHPGEQVLLKVEAAIQGGFKEVVIPRDNLADVLLDQIQNDRIKVTPLDTIEEVLAYFSGSNAGKSTRPKKR